jgi:hypothetical protein
MKKNLSTLESILRLILGFGLATLFFIGGPLWSVVGLYFLLSGSLRFCFIKKLVTG